MNKKKKDFIGSIATEDYNASMGLSVSISAPGHALHQLILRLWTSNFHHHQPLPIMVIATVLCQDHHMELTQVQLIAIAMDRNQTRLLIGWRISEKVNKITNSICPMIVLCGTP